jgi:hypothetical protein
MNTEEIKTNKTQSKTGGLGKKVATHAAAVVAGSVAGVTGASAFNEEDVSIVEQQEEPTPSQQEPTPGQQEPTTGEEPSNNHHGGDAPVNPQPANEDVEPVDPNEIAQAIVAGEEIDPNDINAVAVVNFEEVGTVYDVDGNAYTAATFQDVNGDEYVMVDIDDDSVFDEIYDDKGNYVAAADGLTVSDAQLGIESNGYLAQNETEIEHFDETNGDDYLDDTITT